MRFINVCFLLLVVLSIGCKSKEKEKVELIFPEEKVIDILIDMHYAGEASRISKGINHDSLLNIYTAQVIEIQEIDSSQLAQLFSQLHSDLDTYYDIEKKVHAKMKELNDKK